MFFRLFDTMSRSGDVERLAFADDALDSGCGIKRIHEHFIPLRVGQVGRDQKALSLRSLGDKLEEKIGTVGGLRDVAELIADNEIKAIELFVQRK